MKHKINDYGLCTKSLCRTGAFALVTVMIVMFGSISATVPFLKERSLFV